MMEHPPLCRYDQLQLAAVFRPANLKYPTPFRRMPTGGQMPVSQIGNRWRVTDGPPLIPVPAPDLVVEVLDDFAEHRLLQPCKANRLLPLTIGDECTLADVPNIYAVVILPGANVDVFAIDHNSGPHPQSFRQQQPKLFSVVYRDRRWCFIPTQSMSATGHSNLRVVIAALPREPILWDRDIVMANAR